MNSLDIADEKFYEYWSQLTDDREKLGMKKPNIIDCAFNYLIVEKKVFPKEVSVIQCLMTQVTKIKYE